MAFEAPALKKRRMGRGANHIPMAPTNPDERTLIQIHPGPDSTDFADHRIVKCISQLCLQNWPTPAITWASTPAAHKDAVWAEFQKRYRWADKQGSVISTFFWQKCAARTKDNLAKEREKALHNAGIDHPGRGVLHMHEYTPWWCTADIWVQMCDQWKDEKWVKKRYIASNNRSAGVPNGEKAKGTYKGGSISQLQHITATLLLAEHYPNGTDRPNIGQELWERASIVKKNYVKGQGHRQRPSFSGSCSTESSHSSSHPSSHHTAAASSHHTAVDCVRAICRDRGLLLALGGHLGTLDPDELARAVAAAAASQHDDGNEGSHHDDQDSEFSGS